MRPIACVLALLAVLAIGFGHFFVEPPTGRGVPFFALLTLRVLVGTAALIRFTPETRRGLPPSLVCAVAVRALAFWMVGQAVSSGTPAGWWSSP